MPTWNSLSFMGRLSAPAQQALLRLGASKTLQRNDILVRQGEADTTVYLMLSGRMNITVTVENGSQSLLGIRHAGDLVGEMAMLGQERVRSATVTARERSTVLVLRPDPFRKYLAAYPEAPLAMGGLISHRLDQANTYRADAAGYDVEVRLARALLYQARRLARREHGTLMVELLQSELAMLIGAKETTVQKAMSRPALGPLVMCQRGKVFLLDVPALARVAEIEVPGELR
ncbi:Crp/Fnr family transcriptional regulator [Actinomadura vinacea]|uniref:Crp/Fnr family transcriptional regulator n=1 Tax=Actinomadura vinacea TaxID=115336 RepID=A0ABN3JK48_9ACTN